MPRALARAQGAAGLCPAKSGARGAEVLTVHAGLHCAVSLVEIEAGTGGLPGRGSADTTRLI